MGKRVRNHLRSNVVGYVALFFAMSLGTAYAIDKNSVKSKHIGAGQVKESDLGAGAVTGDKLAANSVDGDNVVDDSLKGADVDEGSLNLSDPPTIPSSLPPSGTAGGDLSGEYPNPQVSESGLTPGGDVTGVLSNAQVVESGLTTGGDLTGPLSNAQVGESGLNAGGDLTGSLANAQIAGSSVGTTEVSNGSLDAADVGAAAGVSAVDFASVPAQGCVGQAIFPGVNPDGETIIATPSDVFDNNGTLVTSVIDSNTVNAFGIFACNVTAAPIDPPSANFSWIVFDS